MRHSCVKALVVAFQQTAADTERTRFPPEEAETPCESAGAWLAVSLILPSRERQRTNKWHFGSWPPRIRTLTN